MASSRIQEVLNYFNNGGFQRTNRFEVNIKRGDSTLTAWASQCQVPSQTIAFYPDNTFSPSGPPIPIPIKREYDERFLIDFIVEGNWSVRKYFENWFDGGFSNLNIGNGVKSNSITPRNTENFLGQITITALDQKDTAKSSFILYEAYPKLLLPGQFSNNEFNQYLTLTVDFNYRYYKFI